MEVTRRLLWLILFIKFCLATKFDFSNFSNITLALYKDVKFIAERLDQVNIDAVFGLTITKANLAAVLSSTNAKYLPNNDRNRLTAVIQLCLYSQAQTKVKLINKKNYPLAPLVNILTRSDIWMREITWRHGLLGPVPLASPNLTRTKVTSLIFNGTPTEVESDHCLIELAQANCRVSDICAEMLLKNDESRGYPLTHRLLFIQTANALHCDEHPQTDFSQLTVQYCRDILQDLIDVEMAGFPSISKDLAMEQIVLCGMEGFMDFTNQYYSNLIMTWQNSYGCYTAYHFEQKWKNRRRKRSTNLMDYRCDSHASGVAAAALSLLLRSYFENWLNPTHP